MAKKKKKTSIVKKILILLIILLLGVAGYIGYKTFANGGGMQGLLSTIVGNDKDTLEELDPIQILLLGISTDLGGKTTDTIMVATYNPKKQTASLLSIPRDTYTGKDVAHGSASEKINAAYARGINKVLEEVNSLTGLELTKYMVIDNQALIKLVDVLGGVEFYVPINMKYTDPTQDLKIRLSEGMQVLDGDKAEQLIRFRKNDDGTGYPASYGGDDYGRMRTQREFMMATAKQTLQAKNIFKIKDIVDIIYEYVETNISISEIKAYVPYVINFNVDDLKSATLPGVSVGPTQTGSLYAPYWFVLNNKKETATLMKELYSDEEESEEGSEGEGTETSSTSSTSSTSQTGSTTTNNITKEEASKIKIELLNGSGSKEKLTKVKKLLKDRGYNVQESLIKDTTSITKTTILNKTNVDSKYTDDIKELLGVGTISSSSASSSNVNITIVIGKDFKVN